MQRTILVALLLLSTGFFCLYTGRGLYLSGISPALPLDFSLRWAEQKDVATGTIPIRYRSAFTRQGRRLAAGDIPPSSGLARENLDRKRLPAMGIFLGESIHSAP